MLPVTPVDWIDMSETVEHALKIGQVLPSPFFRDC